jgi:hypothetical protein
MRYLVATAALLPLLACGPEPSDLGPPSRYQATPATAPGHIGGDVGSMTQLDDPAEVMTSAYNYDGRRLDYVELNTYAGDGSWVMLGIDFFGGVRHPDLVPGETLTFEGDPNAIDIDRQGEGLVVSVTGCSDPDLRDDVPMFDETAPSVAVTLREQPEGEDILVVANFDNGTEAFGSFPLSR